MTPTIQYKPTSHTAHSSAGSRFPKPTDPIQLVFPRDVPQACASSSALLRLLLMRSCCSLTQSWSPRRQSRLRTSCCLLSADTVAYAFFNGLVLIPCHRNPCSDMAPCLAMFDGDGSPVITVGLAPSRFLRRVILCIAITLYDSKRPATPSAR